MVDFGWSAGCVLDAIIICNKIRKALQDAGGAKEQYKEATSFLLHFECIFTELQAHISGTHDDSYREAIVQQLKLMEQPCSRLHLLLSKYEKSLGEKSLKSRLGMMPHKVKWVLKDLNAAVREEKRDLQGPLHNVSLLLQMQSLKTIRVTNEKCQKFVEDIEVSNFAKSLQRGLENLRQHGDEVKDRQVEGQIYLTHLKHSLVLQHAEIMDALQKQREERETSSQSEQTIRNQSGTPSDPITSSAERIAGEEERFERIHAQLKAQQTSLEDVHQALQCLATGFDKDATESKAAQCPEIKSQLKVADAMSIICAAVSAASMFALGYSSRFALPNDHLSQSTNIARSMCPVGGCGPPKSQVQSDAKFRQTGESKSPKDISRQTYEFSNHLSGSQSNDAEHIISASPDQPNTVDYDAWYCCQCDGGPYTKGRTKCWKCWNAWCERCPRTALPPPSPEPDTTCSDQAPCSRDIATSSPKRGHASRWKRMSGSKSSGCTIPSSRKAGRESKGKKTASSSSMKGDGGNFPHGTWQCAECGSVCSELWDTCMECGTPKL